MKLYMTSSIHNQSQQTASLLLSYLLIPLIIIVGMTTNANGQGPIFGQVQLSDSSVPANGELTFIGFVAGSDNELHLYGSIGAGYDAGNWFDDFQNFISAPVGESCQYDFFDTLAGEGVRLITTIIDDGIQTEPISLAPQLWPAPPTNLKLARLIDGNVLLEWSFDTLTEIHIYRRELPSEGSFFRIDDPTGTLIGSGNTSGIFIDNTTSYSLGYDYLLIAFDAIGNVSPPVVKIVAPANCCGLYTAGFTGNTTGDTEGKRNLADITKIIDRIYISKRELWCELSANTDGDQTVSLNLADITTLIDHIFVTKEEIAPCQ